MRYIRTKDGRIIDCVKLMKEAEEHTLRNEDDYKLASVIALQSYDTSLGWQRRVEKTADTIEELCDGFIFKDTKANKLHFLNKNDGISLLGAALFSETLRGYIETDKGLIYVAKMGDKEGFELL